MICLGKPLEGVCVGIDVPRPDVEGHQLRPLCQVDPRSVQLPCPRKMASEIGKSVNQGGDATDLMLPDLSNIVRRPNDFQLLQKLVSVRCRRVEKSHEPQLSCTEVGRIGGWFAEVFDFIV